MSEQVITEEDIDRAANEPREREQRTEPQERSSEGSQQRDPASGQFAGQERQSEADAPQQRQPVLVPVGEVQKERERRKELQAKLDARDRDYASLEGRFSAFEQLFQRQTQPQTPQEPAALPDQWENGEGFARHISEGVVKERLGPVETALQEMRRNNDFNNRMIAGQVHGKEAAQAAEEAFNTAAARGEIDPLEHRRINSSPNPYAAAVEWHKRQSTLAKVGDDPDKWFDSQFEARLGSDPEFQRKVFERLQGTAQAAEAGGRAPPVFASLPSVNGASGSPGRTNRALSEEDIDAAAPQRMGRR